MVLCTKGRINTRWSIKSFDKLSHGGSLFELAEGRYGDVLISSTGAKDDLYRGDHNYEPTDPLDEYRGDHYNFYRQGNIHYNDTRSDNLTRRLDKDFNLMPIYNKAEMACEVVKVKGGNSVKTAKIKLVCDV